MVHPLVDMSRLPPELQVAIDGRIACSEAFSGVLSPWRRGRARGSDGASVFYRKVLFVHNDSLHVQFAPSIDRHLDNVIDVREGDAVVVDIISDVGTKTGAVYFQNPFSLAIETERCLAIFRGHKSVENLGQALNEWFSKTWILVEKRETWGLRTNR